jgi:hypothetical protein
MNKETFPIFVLVEHKRKDILVTGKLNLSGKIAI